MSVHIREAVQKLRRWMEEHPQATAMDIECTSARIAEEHHTTAWLLMMAGSMDQDEKRGPSTLFTETGAIVRRVILGITTTACLALAACGGRTGNPVSQYQPSDEARSCNGLVGEIAANEAEIKRLLPDADATGKNVALGVAGAFFLVPWFFMDFKEGEQIEIDALRRRNAWLREVATDRGCSVPPPGVIFDDEVMSADALVQSCSSTLGPIPQLPIRASGAQQPSTGSVPIAAKTGSDSAPALTSTAGTTLVEPMEYQAKVNSWFDSCDAQVRSKWDNVIKVRTGTACAQASQADKPACKGPREKYGKLRDDELKMLERQREKALSAG